MSNITDFIKTELYPTLFESIDTVFTEHNFKRYSGGWRSKTYLDGSTHKDRKDKTVVSKKAPGFILENGGECLGLVDYVMRRDGVELIEAVKKLATTVGLQLPPDPNFNPEAYKKYKDQATLLEDCNSYFIYCLEKSTGGDEAKAYLSSRGYSDEDVKDMELGYIISQDRLFSYLNKKGYAQELINETVKLHNAIGDTHKLTIPFRSGGNLKGFVVRTLEPGQKNKYINSTGLVRSETFFNIKPIKGDKDLIVVEGYLDALISEVRGVENVVGLGGVNVSQEQIKDAIKKGAKSLTLCLDNDKAGVEATGRAIDIILSEGVTRVYIVTLPEIEGVKTDPDSYIKENGVEAFKTAIAQAIPYYIYRLEKIIDKYNTEANSYKEIDKFTDEIVETGSKINKPTDKDTYLKQAIKSFTEIGITEESLAIAVDRLTSTRDKEAQAKEFKKLLIEANKLQDKGEIAEALELLDSNIKEVKLKDKATEFSRLLIPISEAQIKEEEALLPDSLNTGYTIDGEELLLPGGAITVYAAPTNHGKTILLINTALNVAERYPDKQFIFFTYEERATVILQYFLNTYIDINLNSSDKTNRRLLREYFKTGSTQYFTPQSLEYFKSKKEEFFKTYIETGRILVKYVDYNSQELTTAIEYVNKEATNLGGVFIDYFQLLKLPKEKSSRQEELKQICMSLKDTAVKTGLPLCLAAQFNREVTNLVRLHPTNISEAGDIERIVNTLIGLWNMDKKPVLKGITDAEVDEINNRISRRLLSGEGAKNMYLEILKSRDLPTGSYDFLTLNGNTGKIKNRSSSGADYF